MVRLFQVYYPMRTVVLFTGEVMIIAGCFLAAVFLQSGPDSAIVLNYENGWYRILAVTAIALITSHYFDLYDLQQLTSSAETYFRLLVVLGLLSFAISGIGLVFPDFMFGNNIFLVGLIFLTFALLSWRWAYGWLVRQPFLREKIYVVGDGERAQSLVQGIRRRAELGMEVIGWTGQEGPAETGEEVGRRLVAATSDRQIDGVIVAIRDRRNKLPTEALLQLRLRGIRVEEATTLLERISGKIEVQGIYPSALIFSDGFAVSSVYPVVMRVISCLVAALGLVLTLPLLAIVYLAIRWDSPGPALFVQKRVGKGGKQFALYKFRSMRVDADKDGNFRPATRNDQRFTGIGQFLRRTRLDELPQLWNILKGDMNLVGPRPFVPNQEAELVEKIPFYSLRWTVKPGASGWAQINMGYNATVEDNIEKLSYDLFYIKNMSVGLDLLIIFQTLKTLLLGRGGR